MDGRGEVWYHPVNPFAFFYNEFLWRPLFNGLVGLYIILPGHDLGLAIILLTLIIRAALAPLLSRAQESQRAMAILQPEVKRIHDQFKNNREAQGKALMALYAEHRVSPFFAFLALVVQLPILIALFQVFRQGLQASSLVYLYAFIPHPALLNPVSVGFLNLGKGNIILGVVAALTQYFQTRLITPPSRPDSDPKDFAAILQWQTLYLFPGLILVWSYSLPSALTLYWTVMNTFGIVQELIKRRKVLRDAHGHGNAQK
ncbi:MAG: YidC/Oxa1 family membrane protein insertase [Candidatus Sungbacteria bacterium]|uniref:YidC/Oxa1 family membrane protein insertase n=1 Tax=Candidatus Sungiibacteriota bacterium TaxID=2750080 RepID=A0A932R0I2_9BACT|nr:YidC/Oxa1 family membrane protein insertase [Candidatus Sungbacteria bacterium]